MSNTKSNDELIVAYVFIIEKLTKQNNKYNITYKKEKDILNTNQKYYYNKNLSEIIQNIQDINDFRNNLESNNIIVYCINDDINKYLYDNLINKEYKTINQLNSDLQITDINYEELNSIIETNIQNVINNILEVLNNKFGVNNEKRLILPYYFYLVYNKYTYYPDEYIEQIINRIKQKINDDN